MLEKESLRRPHMWMPSGGVIGKFGDAFELFTFKSQF
jgi:hypothetical protein